MPDVIWRCDDVFYKTNLDRFVWVDSLFKRYGVRHTLAVVARDIGRAKDLVTYIRAQDHIDVQLHGWEHIDYTVHHDLIPSHLKLAVKEVQKHLGIRPTIWYPPWNHADARMREHAANMGLTVSTEKISLAQYVRKGHHGPAILNFHYWADAEVMLLEPALQVYTGRLAESVGPLPRLHDGHV